MVRCGGVRAAEGAGQGLCVADSEKLETPLEVTADFGYFRLRDEGYQPADIEAWARKIAPLRARCKDIYVYFKHEEQGIGPEFARQLMRHLRLGTGDQSESVRASRLIRTVASVASPELWKRISWRELQLGQLRRSIIDGSTIQRLGLQ